ncbi:Elongator subunit elp2 [Lithohypha guttulata]|uniref:Elongator subunit elp2 n=1 Tax=Lithohypha guttulata TaxID=1690604 RepID=UPI00315D35FF
MSNDTKEEYLSIGGNRHTSASAWHAKSACLAFGADQNIALWQPLNKSCRGVHVLLKGHADKVTAVSIKDGAQPILISGAANGELILRSWEPISGGSRILHTTKAHDGAVNVLASLNDSPYFVTGSADATIKVWRHSDMSTELVTTIKPKPRFIPLALAIGTFPHTSPDRGVFVVAAGTRNDMFVYALSNLSESASVTLACSLTGHEGWIRSLALRGSDDGGYMLASTSADKYVRIWRFQSSNRVPQQNGIVSKAINNVESTLTAKVKTVGVADQNYSVTFEALLLGHEDWVYSADWQDSMDSKILTASADGTLAIWQADPTSGIWVSETRLGEISGLKGATTATGSSGGFWSGRWISDGETTAVISLGRTGSWRIWHYDSTADFWNLMPGIGGHIASVNGLSWSPQGEYLLSTSSDQTTRLHAERRRGNDRSWHEFSRCQIHGYDCNVVTCISSSQFVSGADEKLLRVFNEPKELADTLHRLCDIALPETSSLPESAAIPVLGLSNKEIGEADDIIEAGPRRGDDEYAAASALARISLQGINEPPNEDLLSRHSLWPEHEKLYGHGYEISESAYKDGILATACKASSIDHATIRLYDPDNDWRQVEPPLTAHSLTVTRLVWSSGPNSYLLSVGRDRQWTVFSRDHSTAAKRLKLYQAMPKAHTRMILDAAWSPSHEHVFFATAGRDKVVKFWGHGSSYSSAVGSQRNDTDAFELCTTLARSSAVTAVDFTDRFSKSHAVLAVGEEDGTLSVHVFNLASLKLEKSLELAKDVCLSKSVNRLAWRPRGISVETETTSVELAVAGADGSVRILRIDTAEVCEGILSE